MTEHTELIKSQRIEGKERQGPKISIEIFYVRHETREDIESLTRLFNKADIYIPEAFRWTPQVLQGFQDVSKGIKRPKEILSRFEEPSEWKLALLEMIYKSQKPIIFIDVPMGHEIAKQVLSSQGLPEYRGDFRSFIEFMKVYFKEHAESQNARQNFMLATLPIKIEEVLANNPRLREKDKVRVLLSLGKAHTHMTESLEEDGYKIARVLGAEPTFTLLEEATRRRMSGKEVDNLLAAQASIETLFLGIFGEELEEITQKISKISAFARLVASRFDFAEIESIWQKWYATKRLIIGGERPYWRIRSFIEERLKAKGLMVPESEQELDNLLEISRAPWARTKQHLGQT